MWPRISRFILPLLSLLAAATPFWAAAQRADSTAVPARVRGVQYTPDVAQGKTSGEMPLIAGFSVSANLAGAVLATVSSYGEFEGAVRANLRGTYFPVVELGIGSSDHTDSGTNLHYKTRSPFFRIGLDYNALKDKSSGNRLFGGARIGYSSFKYDISGPDLIDPYWHTASPYNFKSLGGNQLWLELVFGIETKIWKFFHVGWSARYKNRISKKADSIGSPWYVPGFGKSGTTVIGGTFNIVFDI